MVIVVAVSLPSVAAEEDSVFLLLLVVLCTGMGGKNAVTVTATTVIAIAIAVVKETINTSRRETIQLDRMVLCRVLMICIISCFIHQKIQKKKVIYFSRNSCF